MLSRTALAVLVAAALPVQAFAADAIVRLDGHLSTLGGGLELAVPLSEKYDARLGFNQFKFSTTQNSGGLNYKGDLKLASVGALVDWRPWSGVTHLTAGAIFNSNKLALSATTMPNTTYMINGMPYTTTAGGDTITSSVAFNKVAPYLGFGWSGHPKNKGFSFSSDFGILFQGSPKATVTTSGAWGGANTSQLTTDAQNQLNTDLKNFKMYPVISFGIGYAF
jgi:hypothetical protein